MTQDSPDNTVACCETITNQSKLSVQFFPSLCRPDPAELCDLWEEKERGKLWTRAWKKGMEPHNS